MQTEKFFESPGVSTMTTYVWEIALMLLGAFILGYLLRLLLDSKYKKRIEELESVHAQLLDEKSAMSASAADTSEFEIKIKDQSLKINDLNLKLSDSYSKKIKAENERDALQVQLDAKAKPTSSYAAASTTKSSTSKKSATSKDDLKRIEGIGPKIEQLLNGGGINSFSELVSAKADDVKAILKAAGPNYAVHDPATWSEQAKLADAGKWEKLDVLQEKLKGGKRK